MWHRCLIFRLGPPFSAPVPRAVLAMDWNHASRLLLRSHKNSAISLVFEAVDLAMSLVQWLRNMKRNPDCDGIG